MLKRFGQAGEECGVAKDIGKHPFAWGVIGIELFERYPEARSRVVDVPPRGWIGTRVGEQPVSRAGRHQRALVGEVAVDGRTAHLRPFGDLDDGCSRRAHFLVQGNHRLDDPASGIGLLLGPLLQLVFTLISFFHLT